MQNIEKDFIEPLRQIELDFYEQVYTIKIKYFVALHYANEKIFNRAYLLFESVLADIEQLFDFSEKNSIKGNKLQDVLKEFREVFYKEVSFMLCKTHARLLFVQYEHFE
jgi:hypothetical protein